MSGSIRKAMNELLQIIESAPHGMLLSDLLREMSEKGFEPATTQAAFRMAVEKEQIELDRKMRAFCAKEMMAA